jgi:hypothetical protein
MKPQELAAMNDMNKSVVRRMSEKRGSVPLIQILEGTKKLVDKLHEGNIVEVWHATPLTHHLFLKDHLQGPCLVSLDGVNGILFQLTKLGRGTYRRRHKAPREKC